MLTIIEGDRVLLEYQLLKDRKPVNIKGCTFMLRVKRRPEARAKALLPPVRGSIRNARAGRFAFLLEGAAPASGFMEITMERPGRKIRLTPPGGVEIKITGKEGQGRGE
ncbi:MAG: hypothetical protein M0Z59_03130 [Nitrospiraceae bacterium]|nr:hypothetical protein [Nitrospiraceae bacterium]